MKESPPFPGSGFSYRKDRAEDSPAQLDGADLYTIGFVSSNFILRATSASRARVEAVYNWVCFRHFASSVLVVKEHGERRNKMRLPIPGGAVALRAWVRSAVRISLGKREINFFSCELALRVLARKNAARELGRKCILTGKGEQARR